MQPDQPQRLTLSRLVELQLAALSRGAGEHSSVTLVRNARGETQITVTVRTGDSPGVDTADDCYAAAKRIYDQARADYPLTSPDPPGGKDGPQ